MKKRILSVILTLCMVLTFVPITVFAAGNTNDFTLTAIAGNPIGFNKESCTNLFDGNTETKWCCNFSDSAYVIFKASEPVKFDKYAIATAKDTADSPERNPVEWTLSGCTDYAGKNTAWTVINSVANGNLPSANKVNTFFYLERTTPFYQYFKLEITKIQSGDIMQLSEVSLKNCTLCNHQWEAKEDTIVPTCIEEGYDIISECSICHWQRKAPSGTSALGHNFADGVCTRCEADESAPYKPSMDRSGRYLIGTVQELYWFAGHINGTVTDGSMEYTDAVLTSDIVINTGVHKDDGNLADDTSGFKSWTPVGYYNGKFDGQGHTVSGLYIDDRYQGNVGLFGTLDSDGEIKNVEVTDSYIRGGSSVGGLCAVNYGTITECSYTGTVSGDTFVGGVCGQNLGGSIIGSRNTASVTGDNYYTGGVSGNNHNGAIINCSNTGTVTSNEDNTGGVCGSNYDATIIGCSNTGAVSCTGDFAGGVSGENRSGTIIGSYNTGAIKSKIFCGGVSGYNDSKIVGCYNIGTIDSGLYYGGVCGSNDKNGAITDCYTIDDEYTETKFRDGTVCVLLNTALKNEYSDVRFYQGKKYPERIFIVDDEYQVNSAAELYGIAQLANSDNRGITSKFMKDIKLSSTIDLSDKKLTIDLNGHILTGDIKLADSSAAPDSILTLKDSNPTATHTDKTLPLGGVVKGNITLTRGNGQVSHLYANGGTVTGMVSLSSYAGGIFCKSDTPTAFMGYVGNDGEIHGGIFYGGIKESCIKEKTVTFMNGNNRYAIEVVADGNNVAAPIVPSVKAGYQAFDGWYNGDTKYTFGSAPSENLILIAKFGNPITYNIVYSLDGGEAENITTYTAESETLTLNNPVKQGYTFTGWSGTDLTGEENMTVTVSKGSIGDRTYTAHYTEKSGYAVVFDTDGGSEVNDKTGLKWTDKVLEGITAPTKEGWEFVDWQYEGKTVDTETAYKEMAASEDDMCIELKAQWKEITAPVISGVENGKIYCSEQILSVTDNDNIASITVNGKPAALDENGQLILKPSESTQTIVVTDSMGNVTAKITVTVTDGHKDGDNDGKCDYCGENTAVLLGDANGDGKVNIKDATEIQKAAASIVVLDDVQQKAADVNGDGSVNVKDATAIQKYIAGIETGYKIGEYILFSQG